MQKSIFTISILTLGIIAFSYIIGACNKKDGEGPGYVQQETPAGFPAPVYQFSDNPLTKDGIELGRALFYDGRLSIDGLHPCSSCHQQIGSFGTYEHDRSHGVFDSHTLRNAPVLLNLAWNKSFHWDGEFKSLEDESTHPITGMHEMGETFNRIIRKFAQDDYYRRMFKKVFHTDQILPIHIRKALAQFTGSIVTADSRYDRYKKGELAFTPQEESGYQLFKSNCATCHTEPLFTDQSFRNIGLPVDNNLLDYGRMRITGKSADSLKFKVPTLRNVYISSNYMHDGRFNTLAQCISHYRSGVQQGPTLDPLLTNGIPLTNAQISDLTVFLRALTDSTVITAAKWGPPAF